MTIDAMEWLVRVCAIAALVAACAWVLYEIRQLAHDEVRQAREDIAAERELLDRSWEEMRRYYPRNPRAHHAGLGRLDDVVAFDREGQPVLREGA